jgi:hypothetical protein
MPMKYELIGILLGLALYNQVLLNLSFPLVMYKKLQNEPVGLDVSFCSVFYTFCRISRTLTLNSIRVSLQSVSMSTMTSRRSSRYPSRQQRKSGAKPFTLISRYSSTSPLLHPP